MRMIINLVVSLLLVGCGAASVTPTYSLVGTWFERSATIVTRLTFTSSSTFERLETFDSGTVWTYTGSFEQRADRVKFLYLTKTMGASTRVNEVCTYTFDGELKYVQKCGVQVQNFSWEPVP